MRSRIWLLVLAATALISPTTLASGASAAVTKVEYAYSSPEISEDGETVTWHWTLVNTGDGDADNVVLVHQLTPALKVIRVSAPCEAGTQTTTCRYGSLAASGRREGELVAQVPEGSSGSVQIKGRVTWREPAPGQSPAIGSTDGRR
ncbi:DUF11 domain-containing protein [Streptomyces sp. S1D4-23]|uniref:DUF11 domain-containing protein n=1 Tax=Streptomyces sp. S1D4-23 TaxID=2594463 RepID=UPI0011649B80|nr:DUF11 domain-containing protein [Streptomyces sp. S1D4-23]QDO06405.1 DUF11 domain-containing protein [Streptomyces sp. S1D4-23]